MVPKINVYLPDELAAAVKDANVPVSAVCQSALERAVREMTALREGPGRGPGTADRTVALADWTNAVGGSIVRYTNRASHALLLGRQAAVAAGHHSVGTEHLLLGILQEGGNLAVRVLEALEIAPDDLERELRGSMGSGDPGAVSAAALEVTENLRAALTLALQESAGLGHNYIGCEHLLLGLVVEPNGLAGSVLRRLGLEVRVTRRAVVTALAGFLDAQRNAATEPPKAPGDKTLQQILERLDAIERRLAG
jgi:ATP-dependent Clp protease ATP-binding subunit ClpA